MRKTLQFIGFVLISSASIAQSTAIPDQEHVPTRKNAKANPRVNSNNSQNLKNLENVDKEYKYADEIFIRKNDDEVINVQPKTKEDE